MAVSGSGTGAAALGLGEETVDVVDVVLGMEKAKKQNPVGSALTGFAV
ncbi:hypothetical protein CS8_038850 [Cupriavidus sp. 8B]